MTSYIKLGDVRPTSARRRLTATSERTGAQLALGPAVAVSHAKRSLKQADTLLSLMRRGLVEGSPLVRADDHDLALELALRLARYATPSEAEE